MAEKSPPLFLRMYQQEHMIDLVRMVGYAGLPTDEARARIQKLTHDKEKMVAACEELFDISADGVKLKAHVRKLAWQLLGAPPEYVSVPIEEMIGKSEKRDDREEVPRNPDKAKKTRGKKVIPGGGTWSKKADKISAAGAALNKSPQGGIEPDNQEGSPAPARPLMQQYREAKIKHPGVLLLFRVGDFYEIFADDAVTVSKLLGLTLTTSNKTKMCGFPFHQLEIYLKKLLHEKQKVAVCDPVENGGKAIAKEIKKVIVPDDGEFSEEPA